MTKTNQTETGSHMPTAGAAAGAALRQPAAGLNADAFGTAAAAILRRSEAALPSGAAERLRFARQQALQVHALRMDHAAQAQAAAARSDARASSTAPSWWKKALAVVPILAAGAGAVFMQGAVSDDGARATVATDLKILATSVPPAAFNDPAFLAYLKTQAIVLPAGNGIAP